MTGWRSGVERRNFSSRAMWRGFDPREGRTEENFLFYFRVHQTNSIPNPCEKLVENKLNNDFLQNYVPIGKRIIRGKTKNFFYYSSIQPIKSPRLNLKPKLQLPIFYPILHQETQYNVVLWILSLVSTPFVPLTSCFISSILDYTKGLLLLMMMMFVCIL